MRYFLIIIVIALCFKAESVYSYQTCSNATDCLAVSFSYAVGQATPTRYTPTTTYVFTCGTAVGTGHGYNDALQYADSVSWSFKKWNSAYSRWDIVTQFSGLLVRSSALAVKSYFEGLGYVNGVNATSSIVTPPGPGMCGPSCTVNEEIYNNVCVPKCPTGTRNLTTGLCVDYCSHGLQDVVPGFYGPPNDTCVEPPCGSGEVIIPPENFCKPNCPNGRAFYSLLGTCDPVCTPGQQLLDPLSRICVANPAYKCASDETKTITGLCVKKLICKEDEHIIDGECQPVDVPCPSGQVRLLTTKKCVVYDPPELSPPPCPVNEMSVNGVCVSIFGPPDSPDCPVGQVLVSGVCKSDDPGTHAPDDDGITQDSEDRCPDGQVLTDGKCVGGDDPDSTPCPEGSTEENGDCISKEGEGSEFVGGSDTGGMGEAKSMQDSYNTLASAVKETALFQELISGSGAADIPTGSSTQSFDMGRLGGSQSLDFATFDSAWAVLRSVLLLLTSFVCLKIVFLKR